MSVNYSFIMRVIFLRFALSWSNAVISAAGITTLFVNLVLAHIFGQFFSNFGLAHFVSTISPNCLSEFSQTLQKEYIYNDVT